MPVSGAASHTCLGNQAATFRRRRVSESDSDSDSPGVNLTLSSTCTGKFMPVPSHWQALQEATGRSLARADTGSLRPGAAATPPASPASHCQ